jgi:hypothetical protein
MTPCLVQQVFRQKIGLELDINLFDEVLFPLLRKEKHFPRELLLDIRMTQSIVIYPTRRPHRRRVQQQGHESNPQIRNSIPPFTPRTFGRMTQLELLSRYVEQGRLCEGRHTSKFRRKMLHECNWGTVDILNGLRDLNHPQIGYHSCVRQTAAGDFEEALGEKEFGNAFIRLEDRPLPPSNAREGCWQQTADAGPSGRGTEFINGLMEYALASGKRPSWGGNKYGWDPILSTHY